MTSGSGRTLYGAVRHQHSPNTERGEKSEALSNLCPWNLDRRYFGKQSRSQAKNTLRLAAYKIMVSKSLNIFESQFLICKMEMIEETFDSNFAVNRGIPKEAGEAMHVC